MLFYISCSGYNSLPQIEGLSPPSETVLRDIGRVFVNHRVHKEVGISLLHKHFELSDEEIMVHDGLRCSAIKRNTLRSALAGSAFFLHNGRFQPHEYEHAPPLTLNEDFLSDLARHLLQNQLQVRLGLSRLDKEHPRLMEHCEDPKFHVCVAVEREIPVREATE